MGITMNQNVIVAKDISKSYQNGPDKISVIQNLSLEIAEKEILKEYESTSLLKADYSCRRHFRFGKEYIIKYLKRH